MSIRVRVLRCFIINLDSFLITHEFLRGTTNTSKPNLTVKTNLPLCTVSFEQEREFDAQN